jgi:hypothetical protein
MRPRHCHILKTAAVGIAALCPVPIGTASAQDAEGPECGRFVVAMELVAGHFVDTGAEGASPGDQRLARMNILDQDGRQIGTRYVVGIAMPAADGKYALHGTLYDDFANGSITSQAIAMPSDITDTSRNVGHDIEGAVTGGTGAFAQATGTMSERTRDDGVREMTFDLICHD